ncbi:DNA polymerase delta, subunit 4-domain-containing protein [Abortiporus biennis]|nr:DNA polymerase delta, subunit 4-domain-containing protein [Abortiporus biennis]
MSSKVTSSKKPNATRNLTQQKLNFRTSRKDSVKGKGKATSTGSTNITPVQTPSTSKPTTPIHVISSDEEKDEKRGKKVKAESGGEPSAKKRKLADGVFQSRDSIENALEPTEEKPEERAQLNVNDKKWRAVYGRAREKMGHLEPIHSTGQNKIRHILRVFDLSYKYGPCIGVSRLQRWERAHALGLDPPPEVKEILLTQQGQEDEYAQCVFYGEV